MQPPDQLAQPCIDHGSAMTAAVLRTVKHASLYIVLNKLVLLQFTLLTAACQKGHLSVVIALVAHGVDINWRDDRVCCAWPLHVLHHEHASPWPGYHSACFMQEMNALQYAAANGRAEVAEFMLQHGANAYNKDEDVSSNLALWLRLGSHKQLSPAQECVSFFS